MTSMQNLIDLTRQRSNLEQNDFCTDAEIQLYLNQSLGEMDDILATDYEDYHVSRYQNVIPVNSSSNIIPLPSNFLKLRGVNYQFQLVASGQPPLWYTVPKFNWMERNQQNLSAGISTSWNRYNISYNLMDQGIEIIPANYCQGTYEVVYTPKFQYLTSPTSILPLYMNSQGWSEYAVVDACIKIFNKQNLDPSGFMAEKEALRQRLISAAKNRDSGGCKSVADVRYTNQDYMWGNFGYGY